MPQHAPCTHKTPLPLPSPSPTHPPPFLSFPFLSVPSSSPPPLPPALPSLLEAPINVWKHGLHQNATALHYVWPEQPASRSHTVQPCITCFELSCRLSLVVCAGVSTDPPIDVTPLKAIVKIVALPSVVGDNASSLGEARLTAGTTGTADASGLVTVLDLVVSATPGLYNLSVTLPDFPLVSLSVGFVCKACL